MPKKGELMSILGMNIDLISKHLESPAATAKGHMIRLQEPIHSKDSNHPDMWEVY
jgi:hypothetical protein